MERTKINKCRPVLLKRVLNDLKYEPVLLKRSVKWFIIRAFKNLNFRLLKWNKFVSIKFSSAGVFSVFELGKISKLDEISVSMSCEQFRCELPKAKNLQMSILYAPRKMKNYFGSIANWHVSAKLVRKDILRQLFNKTIVCHQKWGYYIVMQSLRKGVFIARTFQGFTYFDNALFFASVKLSSTTACNSKST